jgi:hypothetical protein
MKKLSFLLTLGFAVTAAGAVLAGGNNDTETLTKISGYRAWTNVNAKPVEGPVTIAPGMGTFPITSVAV